MTPVDNTGSLISSSVHVLHLSGRVLGGGLVLAQCRMTYSLDHGVTLQLSARAESEIGCMLVLSAVSD